MSIRDDIHALIGDLTAAEKRVARALLANYPSIGLTTTSEFSEAAGTSAPTVLRFVSRLGYLSYPEFQRALHKEIQAGLLSPLDKSQTRDGPHGAVRRGLGAFTERVKSNLGASLESIPEGEFEAACALLSDPRAAIYFLGGRFTEGIASYMAAHLRIVRPGVRRFQGQTSTWRDQLLDIKAGDVVVIFDIRRYQENLVRVGHHLAERRARIILVTDLWLSPVAKYAKVVLPCAIETGQTWDSSAALLVLAEAMIGRVTHQNWENSKTRIQALENIHWNNTGEPE